MLDCSDQVSGASSRSPRQIRYGEDGNWSVIFGGELPLPGERNKTIHEETCDNSRFCSRCLIEGVRILRGTMLVGSRFFSMAAGNLRKRFCLFYLVLVVATVVGDSLDARPKERARPIGFVVSHCMASDEPNRPPVTSGSWKPN